MSDLLYSTLTTLGRPVFWLCSRPVVVGAEHTRRPGGYLLAANHSSPYDIPVLFRHTCRHIDFVSIREVFAQPLVAALYGSMNAFPLDRSRPDVGATKTIVDRLKAGRVVGMFPEGNIRRGETSVLRGGAIRPGIGRLAQLAGVPIVPAAIMGSERFAATGAWLPLRRVRYGVAFGEPMTTAGRDPGEVESELTVCIRSLYAKLSVRI